MGITAEQIKGLVSDAVQEQTGMNPEEFKAFRAQLKAQHEESNKVDRKHAVELMNDRLPKAYEEKAKWVIRGDANEGLGLRFARFVRALAWARRTNESPMDVAKQWGDDWLADAIKGSRENARQKALAAGTLSSGGALVPDEFLGEMIELLRARSTMRAAGSRVVPMRNGSMTIPRQSAGATASYVGENSNITSSQQTFEQIQLTARKLAALTPVSNDLLRESDPSADQIVRDDLVQVMALRESLAFLRGDGTQNQPKGIRNWAASGQVFGATQAGASATLAEVTADLFKMIRLVKASNVPLLRAGWVMSTRSMMFIASLLDSNGNFVYKDEIMGGSLLGWPIHEDNQIPENLGGGSNESEIYFVEFSQALIGDQMAMEVEVFPGGSYHDGSTVISGISTDQTVVRAIALHDFALRHDEAASVLTTVKYGA